LYWGVETGFAVATVGLVAVVVSEPGGNQKPADKVAKVVVDSLEPADHRGTNNYCNLFPFLALCLVLVLYYNHIG